MVRTLLTNNMPKGINAYYEPSTDTVHTGELYSYAWYHEMVHASQQKNSFIRFMTNTYPSLAYHIGFLLFIFLFLSGQDITIFYSLLGVVYAPLVVVFGCCEVDAYIRGWIHYKKKKQYEVELI